MTEAEFLREWNGPEDKILVHTSGSTGRPKPLWVEKQRMLNSARITCDFLDLRPGDTALLCMSLDHIGGKMMVVRSIERRLNLVSVPPSGHPLRDLPCIAPLSLAAMVPMQVYNSLQVAEERARLMQIRHLLIGGGAVDDDLARALRGFPHAVWSTYGMTETLSHIALRRLNGAEATPWYTPFDSVEVSLNDEGCLMVDAPLVHEGLLVTNDRAELSSLGGQTRFRILGRKDNVINSGGIKIQMEEVEAVLKPFLKSPFLIIKQPDGKFGEIVVLLTEDANLSAVSACCADILPKYWRPRRYLHVDRIPLTASGKPARVEALALSEEI